MSNIFAETFPESNGSAWNGRWATQAVPAGTIVDVQSNQGRMATGTSTYGKCGAQNASALSSTDYTLWTSLKIPTVYDEWYAFVHVRGIAGFSNTYQLNNSYQFRFSGGSWGYIVPELYQVDGSGVETLISSLGGFGEYAYDPLAGDTIDLKVQVSGTSPVTVKFKEWQHGATEPAFGDYSSVITSNFTGSYFGLSAQGGAGTTSRDFFWDNVSVDTASVTTNKALTATGSSTASLATVKNTAGLPIMDYSRFTPGAIPARNMRGW